jgi:hypothetical protein
MDTSIIICPILTLALLSVSDAQTPRPAPDSIESHLASGKNAAGGRDDTPDFYGLVTALCVAPLNAPARLDAPAPRMNPNRASAYRVRDIEVGIKPRGAIPSNPRIDC